MGDFLSTVLPPGLIDVLSALIPPVVVATVFCAFVIKLLRKEMAPRRMDGSLVSNDEAAQGASDDKGAAEVRGPRRRTGRRLSRVGNAPNPTGVDTVLDRLRRAQGPGLGPPRARGNSPHPRCFGEPRNHGRGQMISGTPGIVFRVRAR